MTPERIKHFKRLHIQKHHNCDSHLTVGDFNSLMAALEEAEQQNVQLSMNNLNLQAEIESVQIDNTHLRKSIDWWDSYSRDKNEDLIEAQQTIARQREAFKKLRTNVSAIISLRESPVQVMNWAKDAENTLKIAIAEETQL